MFNELKSDIKTGDKIHSKLRKENEILKEKCARSDAIIQGFHKEIQSTTQQVGLDNETLNISTATWYESFHNVLKFAV